MEASTIRKVFRVQIKLLRINVVLYDDSLKSFQSCIFANVCFVKIERIDAIGQ